MNGFLSQGISGNGSLIYFLLPHTISLFVLPHLITHQYIDRYAKLSLVLTVFLTVLIPFLQAYSKLFLFLLGITGALAFLRVLTIIKESDDPAFSAGAGIAIGNILVFLLSFSAAGLHFNFFIISLPLLFSLYFSAGYSEHNQTEGLRKDLLFVFGFYLIGGLFYGSIMPQYDALAILKGSELLSYVLAAVTGITLIRKEREIVLVMGIMLSAVAFSLMLFQNKFLTNLSMFSIQASFAFVDIYIICLLIVHGGSLRVFGYGFGTVCLAIMAGEAFASHTKNFSNILIATGNIILITTVMILYVTGREQKPSLIAGRINRNGVKEPGDLDAVLERLYEPFQKRLSDKERHVLRLIVSGKTYKETAEHIGISESTVKTYIKRICEKLGVDGKDKLMEKLSRAVSTLQTH